MHMQRQNNFYVKETVSLNRNKCKPQHSVISFIYELLCMLTCGYKDPYEVKMAKAI